MLLEIQLCLVFTHFVRGKDLNVIVKVDPKQIVDSLQSEDSLKYLKKLFEIIKKKAADFLMNEVENNQPDNENTESYRKKKINKVSKLKFEKKYILNEEEAYKLLSDPPPDGDVPGWHSHELSDENDDGKRKGVPIFGMKKVNGIYVRRLLDLLSPPVTGGLEHFSPGESEFRFKGEMLLAFLPLFQ